MTAETPVPAATATSTVTIQDLLGVRGRRSSRRTVSPSTTSSSGALPCQNHPRDPLPPRRLRAYGLMTIGTGTGTGTGRNSHSRPLPTQEQGSDQHGNDRDDDDSDQHEVNVLRREFRDTGDMSQPEAEHDDAS